MIWDFIVGLSFDSGLDEIFHRPYRHIQHFRVFWAPLLPYPCSFWSRSRICVHVEEKRLGNYLFSSIWCAVFKKMEVRANLFSSFLDSLSSIMTTLEAWWFQVAVHGMVEIVLEAGIKWCCHLFYDRKDTGANNFLVLRHKLGSSQFRANLNLGSFSVFLHFISSQVWKRCCRKWLVPLVGWVPRKEKLSVGFPLLIFSTAIAKYITNH